MAKAYIGISAIIFALVALVHLVRIAQGWQVQLGETGVAMSVSWIALVVSAALAVSGALLLSRCRGNGRRGLYRLEQREASIERYPPAPAIDPI